LSVEVQSFIELKKKGDRAILLSVQFYRNNSFDDGEFKRLVYAAGVQEILFKRFSRDSATPKYFIGKGQAEQVSDLIEANGINLVLINENISAAQGRNLEKILNCRVIDRTELILDIFAQRALSFEGKLQVELAQLRHIRTRLIRGWTHLERQRGGIGMRGPGETQLEMDRRLIDQRIKKIKARLDKVFRQRSLGRIHRKKNQMLTVSCVGYTNAGKSTLFNAMTESNVFADDLLFATLDPTLRTCSLPGVGDVLIADTVGFIKDLPHDLIAAFRATLEETRMADLLLHVVDASSDNARELISSVDEVLLEVEAGDVPVLLIFNKIDAIDVKPRIDRCSEGFPVRVWVSAEQGLGMDLLYQAVSERLSVENVSIRIDLPFGCEALRAKLYSLGAVVSEVEDSEKGYILDLKMTPANFKKYLDKK
jgi:GTPase